MDNSLNSSSSVYVDLTALTNWSSQIKDINEQSILVLNNLLRDINDLETYWVGNLSKGFIDDSTSLIKNIQKSHNDMESVPVFLIDVVNTMNDL